MKDIKTFVIGFLTCACLFLIMGQTKADNQVGRYQFMYKNEVQHYGKYGKSNEQQIHSSMTIDTKTGTMRSHLSAIFPRDFSKNYSRTDETQIVRQEDGTLKAIYIKGEKTKS